MEEKKLVEIKTMTNGQGVGTAVYIDGRRIKNLMEFNLSVRTRGKIKIQMKYWDEEEKMAIPLSFFGGDFEKFINPETEKPEFFIGQSIP